MANATLSREGRFGSILSRTVYVTWQSVSFRDKVVEALQSWVKGAPGRRQIPRYFWLFLHTGKVGLATQAVPSGAGCWRVPVHAGRVRASEGFGQCPKSNCYNVQR